MLPVAHTFGLPGRFTQWAMALSCLFRCTVMQALVLGPGDHVEATAGASAGLRFLLIAGKPIGEPIVQHGPFVMNTQEEIYQVSAEREGG